MALFEYDQGPQVDKPSEDGSSTPRSETELDEIREFKPVSVVDSGSNGYTQLRVTIPSKFVDEFEISSDDHMLMGVRDGQLVMVPP